MSDSMQRWTAAMRAERYAEAWALSHASLAARDPASRDDPTLPYHLRWVWDGRAFDGAHVLVRCYHGLGDTIQFARFLPLLARRAKSVTVEAQPCLLALLATIDADIALHPFDPAQPLPPADCDIEITELPFALAVRPDAVRPPYLRSSRAALPPGIIGLCHSTGEWDVARRLPPQLFGDICAHHRCMTLVPAPSDLAVLNPEGCTTDVQATAALIASLDLVITVDTMIAHLAGALGQPVWLLLKAEPDWRWSPDRVDSPWYPSARLFVQPEPGAWAPVVERVAEALAELPQVARFSESHR